MPNPKHRHSKTRRNMRRAHDALTAPGLVRCPNCDALTRPHAACIECGYYKGQEVVDKSA